MNLKNIIFQPSLKKIQKTDNEIRNLTKQITLNFDFPIDHKSTMSPYYLTHKTDASIMFFQNFELNDTQLRCLNLMRNLI